MKKTIISLVTCLVCFVASAQKKAAFDYPDEAVTDSAKKEFKKQFHKGQEIYKVTCARCHNKIVNGKEVIPNFSLPQLMDYEMRIFPEHSDKLTDKTVTDIELANIISFLRYRTKTN